MPDFVSALCQFQVSMGRLVSVEQPDSRLMERSSGLPVSYADDRTVRTCRSKSVFDNLEWTSQFGTYKSPKPPWRYVSVDTCCHGAPYQVCQVWMTNFDLNDLKSECPVGMYSHRQFGLRMQPWQSLSGWYPIPEADVYARAVSRQLDTLITVSYTHLTLPTILLV